MARTVDPSRYLFGSRLRRALRWLVMPGTAALLLLGVWLHQSRYASAQAYDGYHARCRSAIAAIPTQIGPWIGTEIPLPQPALDLLDPNAQRNIRFTDYSPAALSGPDRRVSVMLVQCRLAKDMQGHYPPRCYPAHGARLLNAEPRQWVLRDAEGGLTISGMEYHFVEPDRITRDLPPGLLGDESLALGRRRVVLNFMIVPGAGIRRDMKGVNDAAEDYKQRHRGAAQVQVVFDPSLALPDRRERDAILVELLSAAMPALRVLMDLPPEQLAQPPAVAEAESDLQPPALVAGADR